jgi:hypothetical protein
MMSDSGFAFQMIGKLSHDWQKDQKLAILGDRLVSGKAPFSALKIFLNSNRRRNCQLNSQDIFSIFFVPLFREYRVKPFYG